MIFDYFNINTLIKDSNISSYVVVVVVVFVVVVVAFISVSLLK
jgi:hypothetical protein